MNENETIADIRKDAEARFRELCKKYLYAIRYLRTMQEFNTVFDRIEATARRERGEVEQRAIDHTTAHMDAVHRDDCRDCVHRTPVGDSAAMREALLVVKRLFDGGIMFQPAIRKAHKAVDAALAAPPRNCDIYTTEDAVDTATVTVRDECDACPSLDMEAPCVFCMVRWLLAPAQKGGAK